MNKRGGSGLATRGRRRGGAKNSFMLASRRCDARGCGAPGAAGPRGSRMNEPACERGRVIEFDSRDRHGESLGAAGQRDVAEESGERERGGCRPGNSVRSSRPRFPPRADWEHTGNKVVNDVIVHSRCSGVHSTPGTNWVTGATPSWPYIAALVPDSHTPVYTDSPEIRPDYNIVTRECVERVVLARLSSRRENC